MPVGQFEREGLRIAEHAQRPDAPVPPPARTVPGFATLPALYRMHGRVGHARLCRLLPFVDPGTRRMRKMDERLERLSGLPLYPARLAKYLAEAHAALPRPSHPIYATRMLAALTLLADLAAFIAGSPLRVVIVCVCTFAALRLARSSWDLPPGPWWSWELLIGFDPTLVVMAAAVAILVPLLLAAICVGSGRLLHAALNGQSASMPRARTLVAAALIATLAVLASCNRNAPSDVASDCGNMLSPSALGTSWWRLDCSPAAPTACRVMQGREAMAIEPGHRLIVSTDQVRRIDFMPALQHCAAEVVLAGESVAAAPIQPVAIKVDPIRLEPVSVNGAVSMDAATRDAFTHFTAAMHDLSARLRDLRSARLEVGGRVEAVVPEGIKATLQVPQLQRAVDGFGHFVDEYMRANRRSERALQVQDVCITTRKARKAVDRARLFLHSDPDCLAALRLHDADSAKDVRLGASP